MLQLRGLLPRRLSAFTLRSLGGLLLVLAAGIGFGVLAELVQSAWGPLRSADHGIVARLSEWVSGKPAVVTTLQIVTTLGDSLVLTLLLALATVWLLIRRRVRLAAYVAVTGIGAAILVPTTKELVGRARPLVGNAVAVEDGASFPSGHALGSIVAYGVLLLVFLPAIPRRARAYVAAALGLLVAAIGFTRVALGVHFLSDVLGGWLLGLAWLGLTTAAFQRWRHLTGLRVPPITRGLEPEAEPALEPAPDERLGQLLARPWRALAELITAWVLVLGLVYGAGLLVTEVLAGGVDRAVVHWFAAHRGPTLTAVASAVSWLGSLWGIVTIGLVAVVLAIAATRRWQPLLFLFTVLAGEFTLYLVTSRVIDRHRPRVPSPVGQSASSVTGGLSQLTSFPSGHVAAATALYGGVAVLVMGTARGAWRWLAVALAVVIPGLVGAARLYLGLHYPSDYAGSLLVALPWLAACWWVLQPHSDSIGHTPGGR